MKDVRKELIRFFKKNPSPSDKQVHALSDKLGIDTHKFEAEVYALLGSFLAEGKSKGKDKGDVDKKQLAMGREVEMEHTTDPRLAEKIAHDHLVEIPDYYDRLADMEEEAMKEGELKEAHRLKSIKNSGGVHVWVSKSGLGDFKSLKEAVDYIARTGRGAKK